MMSALVKEDTAQLQLEHCRRLVRLLSMTKEMLALADKGEWQRIAEMEVERRQDLAACFDSMNDQPADQEVIAEAVAAMLHLNEELMAKLRATRETIMKQGAEVSRNLTAISEYHQVGMAD